MRGCSPGRIARRRRARCTIPCSRARPSVRMRWPAGRARGRGAATGTGPRAGWRRASFDTVAAGSSFGVGGQIFAPLGARAAVQAGLGARRLDPDIGRGTTPLTAALGLRLRPARFVAGGIGYSRAPFDETAVLIARGLIVDALDWSVDISPSPRWSVSAGGGGAWLSD